MIRGLSLPRVPLRLRLLFRGLFLLLALALGALALSVLQDEKQRSQRVYAESLGQSQAQIAARLRHPTGQLALLNPEAAQRPAQPLRPLVLPFRALDFDDRHKALQAVEMAGCALQYPSGATLCAAVGSNAFAGGFVYLVAGFELGELSAHASGDLELSGVHRAVVDLDWRGQRHRWVAPYEIASDGRGRLVGFAGDAPLARGARPVRDFRGWLWHEGGRGLMSLRLPVEALRDELAQGQVRWPPPDLDRMALRLRLLAPGEAPPVFDSDAPGATLPFSLEELRTLLRPGERLEVRRAGAEEPLLVLTGPAGGDERIAPWIAQLIRRLPADGDGAAPVVREAIATPLGRYELTLAGDLRSVNLALAAVATRLAWTVGAMLLAVGATWALLELFVMRRITLLTRRAAAVSTGVRDGAGLAKLDLSDLGGRDELGVLAQGLKDLLQRVHDDLQRERIRARQEQDQWHAVGHEIMSPLQSLMALHGTPGDPSARYIARMQQAVRVLYGQASPSEAFEATTLALETLDLDAFLGHVAANARYIEIDGVEYASPGRPLPVRADEHSLEDVVTHVLRNAARHRMPGTPIRLALRSDERQAELRVHNQGPAIDEAMRERIFEYGVSDAPEDGARRGQGLFVARTYMAKMGGTIEAVNEDGGVAFVLRLPLA